MKLLLLFPYPSQCNYYYVETASVRFESISLSLVFIVPVADPAFVHVRTEQLRRII